MNIAFQIEVLTNSDGSREIVNIDCDPTAEAAEGTLDATEIDAGAWELPFVVSDDFNDAETRLQALRTLRPQAARP